MVLAAVFELPKPMILPPRVVLVRNHASAVKVCGAEIQVDVAPGTVAEPLNVVAVLVSPVSAPATLRVVPDRVRSLPLIASQPVLPEVSPSRQWRLAPSAATVAA